MMHELTWNQVEYNQWGNESWPSFKLLGTLYSFATCTYMSASSTTKHDVSWAWGPGHSHWAVVQTVNPGGESLQWLYQRRWIQPVECSLQLHPGARCDWGHQLLESYQRRPLPGSWCHRQKTPEWAMGKIDIGRANKWPKFIRQPFWRWFNNS